MLFEVLPLVRVCEFRALPALKDGRTLVEYGVVWRATVSSISNLRITLFLACSKGFRQIILQAYLLFLKGSLQSGFR
jgi:hypothetical protein